VEKGGKSSMSPVSEIKEILVPLVHRKRGLMAVESHFEKL
jgi:hypothetical protein